jgi:hypothetical protein
MLKDVPGRIESTGCPTAILVKLEACVAPLGLVSHLIDSPALTCWAWSFYILGRCKDSNRTLARASEAGDNTCSPPAQAVGKISVQAPKPQRGEIS